MRCAPSNRELKPSTAPLHPQNTLAINKVDWCISLCGLFNFRNFGGDYLDGIY